MAIKCFISLIFAFGLVIQMQVMAQDAAGKDTSFLMSITIFNKKDTRNDARFPDVYPNVHGLYFVAINSASVRDTVSCYYEFPFIKIDAKDYVKIRHAKHIYLDLYYTRSTDKTTNTFFLSIPVKYPLSTTRPIFIVVERFDGDKFSVMQKKGTTLLIEGPASIKSIKITGDD